jgi:hypothetical protein
MKHVKEIMKKKTIKREGFKNGAIRWIKLHFNHIGVALTFLTSALSLIISAVSLISAIQSYRISEIALKQSSSSTEPLLTFDIDYWNDTISVKNETAEIFQIYHVNFGKIQTIALYDAKDYDKISVITLEDKVQSMNLEHGHTTGTDTSDKDAEKYNKSFELSLDADANTKWAMWTNNTEFIEDLENEVNMICERDNKYSLITSVPFYDLNFIEIYYMDAYKNRSTQYYVYYYEYSSSWKFYKLSETEYLEYIADVMTIDTNNASEKQVLIDLLFSESNFSTDIGPRYKLVDLNAPKYKSNY